VGDATNESIYMIKWLLVVIMLQLSSVTVDAQRLYAIAFANTDDAYIGGINKKDLSCFEDYTDSLASEMKCEKIGIECIGDDCTKSRLEKTINNIRPTVDDIVIFAYLGHGGRSSEDVSIFPQMTLNSYTETEFVPLEDVKMALVNKGAGFVFVIGNCSNSFNGLSPQKNVFKTTNDTNVTQNTMKSNTQGLFSSKGSVIVSASSKGECAWAAIVNGEQHSLFMYVLLNELKQVSSTASWEDVLSATRQKVADYFRENIKGKIGDHDVNSSQTPAYAIDIH